MPLDAQQAVREIAAKCGSCQSPVTDGSCLTVWAVTARSPEAPHYLEPLAAQRLDRTLAVEPVELVAERAVHGDEEEPPPLHYGECFRLRVGGCSNLYLGHSGCDGGMRWITSSADPMDEEVHPPPSNTRFAAHGGELRDPLLYGRSLTLQRVPSPAPAEESGSDSDSDDGALSPRAAADAKAMRAWARASRRKGAQPEDGDAAAPTTPDAARCVREGLFARVADAEEGVFPAAFLPILGLPPA